MKKRMKKAGIAFLTVAIMAGSALATWAATRLETVSDPWWNEEVEVTIAEWDEVENAFQYEVYLYRNESKIAEIKTKKTTYNFKSRMTGEGEYMFRVRAIAKSGSKEFLTGYWSSYADSVYINADYAEFLRGGGIIDTENSGPAAKTETSAATPSASVVPAGQWIQDTVGWWYRRTDGTYPLNQWFLDTASNKWYYMNPTGYMLTGWLEIGTVRYYCGPDGAMLLGSQTIDGVTYQFDASGALMNR